MVKRKRDNKGRFLPLSKDVRNKNIKSKSKIKKTIKENQHLSNSLEIDFFKTIVEQDNKIDHLSLLKNTLLGVIIFESICLFLINIFLLYSLIG